MCSKEPKESVKPVAKPAQNKGGRRVSDADKKAETKGRHP